MAERVRLHTPFAARVLTEPCQRTRLCPPFPKVLDPNRSTRSIYPIRHLSSNTQPQRVLGLQDHARPVDVVFTAEELGINIASERPLLWIARRALNTPLPPDWTLFYVGGAGAERRARYRCGGEETDVHPGDMFFRSLLEDERAVLAREKRGHGGGESKAGSGVFAAGAENVEVWMGFIDEEGEW